MNWIFVLFFLEICLFILAFLLSEKDIMAPSVMMSAMFLISTFFAILSLEKLKAIYSIEACFILFTGILTFIIAETVFRNYFQKRSKRQYISQIAEKTIAPGFQAATVQNWMIIALIIFNTLVFLWYYNRICYITGRTGMGAIGVYRNINVHTEIAKSEDRLMPLTLSQLIKVATASGYICAFLLIQKIILRKRQFLQKTGLLCVIVISQAMNLLSGGRTSVLIFASAILIEYYCIWHYKNGWTKNLSYKYIIVGILCVLIGSPLFHYSRNIIGRPTSATLFEEIAVYFGYSIWLFDEYIKKPSLPLVFGEETLSGIRGFLSRVFGLNIYVGNAPLEFRTINGETGSNIYTFFRRPAHDFGLMGMYVFTILVAALFAWIYYKKIKWNSMNRRSASWTLIYGYLYYWIIVSSIEEFSFSYLSFSSITIALAIVIGYLTMTNICVKNGKVIILRNRGSG